jgi:hypothetical protein
MLQFLLAQIAKLKASVSSIDSKLNTTYGPKIAVTGLSLDATGDFTKDVTTVPQTLDGKSLVAVIPYSSTYRLVPKAFAGATLYYSVVSASSGSESTVNLVPVYQ